MRIGSIIIARDDRVQDFDEAWARAWANITRASKDGTDINKKTADGKARRYTTLAAVDAAIRKALTDEGFVYPQALSSRVDERGIWVRVHTEIRRKGVAFVPPPYDLLVTGQMMKGGQSFRPPTAQDMGSANTYARRYSLTSVFGVCPDEDDDGTSASRTTPTSGPWDGLNALANRLAAGRRCSEDEAHRMIDQAAGLDHEATERDIPALVDAAERLLREGTEAAKPPEKRARAPRAFEEWQKAARAYCHAQRQAYRKAEGEDASEDQEAQWTSDALEISAKGAGVEKWPGKTATAAQCAMAVSALDRARKGE